MKSVRCEDCNQSMGNRLVTSCNIRFRCIKINGEIYARNTTEFDFNGRCHDCGITNKIGNLHHFGCDVERCPKCKKQLISCNCKKQEIGINEKWKKI